MQLGLENKKKATWAAVLGVLAVLIGAYVFIPMFTGSSEPDSSAQAAANLLNIQLSQRLSQQPTTRRA